MDKDLKLKRYHRKDYSETVGFPVEIVGRDGVVRHYDFEESIRLYQRRMSFAPMRFQDDDLVVAEQGHCKARIEQLRNSFFQLHGWTTPEGRRGPESSRRDLAGELTAFLLRVLRDPGRVEVDFTELERAEPGDLWYAQRGSAASGLLLYAFVFDGFDGEEQQLAFLELLRSLRSSEHAAGDAESLVAYHHAVDCGFVLTGRADDVTGLAAAADASAGERGGEPSPWDALLEFVRKGDLPAAYLQGRSILEAQPWHRDAYVMGAALAVALRRPGDAEDLAFVGTGYFPADGLLHHYLGLARLHQGRPGDAAAALTRALELQPDLACARSLLVVALADRGRFTAIWRVLTPADPAATQADDQTYVRVRGLVRSLSVLSAGLLLAVAASVALLVLVGLRGLVPLVAVVALCVVGALVLTRRATRLRELLMLEDLQVALQRLRRTRAEAGPRR